MTSTSYYFKTSLSGTNELGNRYLHFRTGEKTDRSPVRASFHQRLKNKTGRTSNSALTFSSIVGLRVLLDTMKGQIDIAKLIVNRTNIALPAVGTNRISNIKIPRIPRIVINGNVIEDTGTFHAEWIFPETNSSAVERVILYIHGGAYVIASKRTHRGITSRLANYASALVLSIDYRLAPDHVFPKPLIDVLSAYKFLLDIKFESKQISFVGDSAGGGLATAAMLYCRDTGLFPQPAAVGAMSPYMDMTQSLPSWYLHKDLCYLPDSVQDEKYLSTTRNNLAVAHDKDMINPAASPLYSCSTNVPTCPILIQVGDCERVRDDSLVFYSHSFPTDSIKVEMYQDSVHVFQLFSPFDPFSKLALQRLGQFIAENSGKNQPPLSCQREAIQIMNDKDYTEIPVPDVHGIIEDGILFLLETNQWKIDQSNVLSLNQ